MKIIFIFPFKNTNTGSPFKWLSVGVPVLIGNLKKFFPQIIFHQIDLEEEISEAFRKDKLNKKYLEIFNFLENIRDGNLTKKQEDLLNNFFSNIVSFFNFNKYDHYFFSVYNRNSIGIKTNILLAKYLKKRYKNKKIVFGGIYGFENHISEKAIKNIQTDFIDSIVIHRGENSTKKILESLLKKEKIEKVYKNPVTPEDYLANYPDFKSFKNIKYFQHSFKDFEKLYRVDLNNVKSNEKVLFIPYVFSSGCFWSKCAYCTQSGDNRFYCKKINQIIHDLYQLKKKYKTKYFIFYNNNFNFDLNFSKKLLKAFIKNKLNILWTDSFNLSIMDKELINLLAKAGCFRMDIGVTVVNPKIQELYNNILQNKHLEYLEEISQKGIWSHINIIANLPYQYDIKKEKKIYKKYMKYIDGVTLNSYRPYSHSRLEQNYNKYDLLKLINEKIKFFDTEIIIPFIEKDFKGSLKERKKIFINNFLELHKFFVEYKKRINSIDLYLLGYLYNYFGFNDKNKIIKIIQKIDYNVNKNEI